MAAGERPLDQRKAGLELEPVWAVGMLGALALVQELAQVKPLPQVGLAGMGH